MPFVNGQFVAQPDEFDYRTPFARGQARSIYARGDADEAARVLMPHDPQAANVYAQEGERRALRSAAQAYAGENYDEAARIFGERGNIQGVQAARGARNNQRFSRELQTANRYRGELRRIQSMPAEAQQSAYEDMLSRAEAETDNPDGKAFLSNLRQQIPQWSPEAFDTLDNILLRTAQAYQTDSPKAFIETWAEQQKMRARQRRTLTPAEVAAENLRPGTVAQINPETNEIDVVQAPPAPREGGSGDIASNPERIRLEREFAKDWKNVSTDFQGIKDQMGRIETMASRQDSAGDLALVVSFTKMLDPGSVAREGEVALTQSAASAAAQAQNWLPRLQRGNTLLPKEVRAQLLSASREMFGVYNNAYHRLAQDYQTTAAQYGYAADRVMMGYRPQDALPVPGRGMPEHGGRYQMANGTVGVYDRETNKFYAENDPRAPRRPNQLGPAQPESPPSSAVVRSFSTLPPASQFAGKTVRNPSTGERMRSDGQRWVKVE
jgi:hypothetical protein